MRQGMVQIPHQAGQITSIRSSSDTLHTLLLDFSLATPMKTKLSSITAITARSNRPRMPWPTLGSVRHSRRLQILTPGK